MTAWIDIKTGVPDDRRAVLITNGTWVTAARRDLELYAGKIIVWWDPVGVTGYDYEWEFEHGEVTHWAEMPKPPAKEEQTPINT